MSLPIDFGALPQISLGTAALLIFGGIASLAMLRGLMRILWGTIIICLAGAAAFLTWQHAPSLVPDLYSMGPHWLQAALPFAAFIFVFLVLRVLTRFLIRPLGEDNDEIAEKNRRSPIRWITTLVFSLVPAAILCLTCAVLLRHVGSVAELKNYADTAAKDPISKSTAFLIKVKEDLEKAIPTEWLAVLDPKTSDLRLTLAKLISSGDDPAPKALLVIEEPAMREIILGDPQLRQLAREGRYSEILRDPRLDQILENPDVREVLQGLDL